MKELPEGWKWTELKDIVTLLGDGLHGTPKYSDSGEYFFINGNNLVDGEIQIKENTKRISKDEYQKHKKYLTNRTILVSINGTIGNIAFYNNEKIILGKSACYFNLIDSVDKKYIRLVLSSQHFLNYAHTTSTGSTIKNVSLKAMREYKVPLPSFLTQQAIVSKIEELFSELDKGIENLRLAQQQLKTYRQSVLKWAFEGKLTNENVKDGELPAGWRLELMGDLLEFVGSGVTPKGGQSVYQMSGIMFLRSQNIYPNELYLDDVAYISNEVDEKMKRSRVQSNDILLNITGASIGRCTFVPKKFPKANVNQHVCILRVIQQVIRPKFLSYYLNSPNAQQDIMNMQSGATRQGLNYNQIRAINIPLCSVETQNTLINLIENRFSLIEKVEDGIKNSLLQAESLRQSILKDAFNGNLLTN